MSSIGVGQCVWLRMWNDDAEGDDAIIADGVLMPGEDFAFRFAEPQTVTRVSLGRITRAEADRLAAEKGVKEEFYV